MLKKGPKYGNDRDEADIHASRLISTFVNILKGFTNDRNIPYAANMIPTTSHLPFGELTAASADGRLAEMPLSEGISPVQGMDLSGPTAVIKTMGKIDHESTAGTLLNMKFTPRTLVRAQKNPEEYRSLLIRVSGPLYFSRMPFTLYLVCQSGITGFSIIAWENPSTAG